MSREQLEKFALNLRNEVEREREERNYFQLERDQLRQFWEITKNQLGKASSSSHNKFIKSKKTLRVLGFPRYS